MTRRHSGHKIPTMKGKLILHTTEMKGEEAVEMKVWQVPKSSENPHGINFSVVYIKSGQKLIGYDKAESQEYLGIQVKKSTRIGSRTSGSLLMISKKT